jgi:hypothetical protein
MNLDPLNGYSQYQPREWNPLPEAASEAESGEVRDDVVRRGRALLADSSYPPFDVCEQIAEACLNSEMSVHA